MGSVVLGMALAFAAEDPSSLELTLRLSEPATVALAWADLSVGSTVVTRVHRFGPLPFDAALGVTYAVRVGRQPLLSSRVLPIPRDRLRFAVLGDSEGGTGPRRILDRRIRETRPNLTIQPDELEVEDGAPPSDDDLGTMAEIGSSIPRLAYGEPARAVSALRLGPALIVMVDSSVPLAAGSAANRELDEALTAKGDASHVLVVMQHGPISSGPRGGHRDGEELSALFSRHRVAAVFSGHDHVYERLEQDGVTYVVSGGGGAPLDARHRSLAGTVAFASTYHFVLVAIESGRAWLEAYSLEGVLLDRVELGAPAKRTKDVAEHTVARALVGALALLGALSYALWRIVGTRRHRLADDARPRV